MTAASPSDMVLDARQFVHSSLAVALVVWVPVLWLTVVQRSAGGIVCLNFFDWCTSFIGMTDSVFPSIIPMAYLHYIHHTLFPAK